MKFMTKMATHAVQDLAEKVGGWRDALLPAAMSLGLAGHLGNASLSERQQMQRHTDNHTVQDANNRLNGYLRARYDRDVAPKLDRHLQHELRGDKFMQELRDLVPPGADDLISVSNSHGPVARTPGITPETRAANARLSALEARGHLPPMIPMRPFGARR